MAQVKQLAILVQAQAKLIVIGVLEKGIKIVKIAMGCVQSTKIFMLDIYIKMAIN